MLNIPNIKSYVISLKRSTRRERLKETFDKLGMANWSFYDGIDVKDKFPYWVGVGLSHYELLLRAKYPCVIYEDDVAPTEWYRDQINLPEDRFLYLGLSRWGTKTGTTAFNGSVFYDTEFEGIYQVKYMTSTHAIYYPNREIGGIVASGILRCLFELYSPFDVWLSHLQVKQPTFCCVEPLFYQDDVKNSMCTNFRLDGSVSEPLPNLPPQFGFFPIYERNPLR